MATATWTPTAEQQAIYDEFATGASNVIIDAYAGTGKTTTVTTGVRFAPERNILFTCFNKKIEVEGNCKLAELGITTAKFQTLHSCGARAVYKFWEGVHVADDRRGESPWARKDGLTDAVCSGAVPDEIKKLVGKLHTLGREMVPHATQAQELYDIAVRFECEPDQQWEAFKYDTLYVCQKAIEAMELAASKKPADGLIDFSDMIFLPVRNGWLAPTFDMVIVDEYQDLTTAKLEMAQRLCRGRLFIVGDPNQAIYGFIGADTESASRLGNELNAKTLKLTETFRCGKAIVREAQAFVGDYKANEQNGEGEVLTVDASKLVDMAGAGDFILSRVNAPLVSYAMRLLRAGKRTRIAGRDIGKGLIALIRKLKARSIPDMLSRISAWEKRELTRLQANFSTKMDSPAYITRKDAILDQSAMLADIANSCKSVAEVESKITALFTDDGLGDKGVITCSSVHRSKGLEAGRVFVLADTLRDFNQEELNIRYVAVTRAINTLVYVRGS